MSGSLVSLGLRLAQVRFIACALAGVQVLSPVVATAAEVAKAHHSERNVQYGNSLGLDSQQIIKAGKVLSAGDGDVLRSSAAGMASSAVNAAAHEWFAPFGTVRSSVNVDSSLKVRGSSVDLLVPLYDDQKNMVFTQLGLRNEDDRNTLNVGVGARVFNDDWMHGVNVFLDNDFSGNNRRIGIGLEAWTDFLKLSANSYVGLTDWHQSGDFADYDERPANGWDLRMEGWLPAYPQLGAKLAFEQYYGHEVALSSRDSRAKNPNSLTGGITWTPVPLVTIGGEQRIYGRGEKEGGVFLELNYRPGVSLKKQLDSSTMAGFRTLAGSRTDLVERNNKVVLDYQKKNLISLGLPTELEGAISSSLTIVARVTSKYALKAIDWSSPQLLADGGSIKALSAEKVVVVLPAQARALPYVLTAIAHDVKGNVSKRSAINILVSDLSNVSQLKAVKSVNPASLPSDGVATSQIQLMIADLQGRPVSGLADQLSLEVDFQPTVAAPRALMARNVSEATANTTHSIVPYTEVSAGLYQATMTAGMLAGIADVVTTYHREVLARSHITLTAKAPANEERSLAISVLETGSIADGISANQVKATVTDGLGNPVSGSKVSFTADTGTLSVSSETTDQNGSIVASLTSTSAGTSTVKAVFAEQTLSATVTFVADEGTAAITSDGLQVVRDGAVANGIDSNRVKVTVVDVNGNPLSGIAVHFDADNDATVAASSVTGDDGTTAVDITSTRAGNSTLRATVDGRHSTVELSFAADLSTLKPELSVVTDFALADGSDRNEVGLTVTDAHGNPLADQSVQLSADNGASIAATATTDQAGQVSVFLTSTTAGSSVVTAVVGGQSAEASVSFLADEGTASIGSGGMQVVDDNALANGTDSNRVKVTVVDANSNPLAGVTVHFTADNHATVATSGITGDDGSTTVTITSTTAGNSTVRASLEGEHATVQVSFSAVIAAYIDVETSEDKARVGDAIALTVKTLDSSKKPMAHAEFSIAVTNVRNRQNSAVTSGVLELDGADVNPTHTFKTNASGELVLTVTDPQGTGVSRQLKVSSGKVSASKQLVFTVLTSPDSPSATMWGHMSDSITVGNMTFLRPALSGELTGSGTYSESGETWARPYQTNMATLCPISPSINDLALLYAAYPGQGINTTHGWPVVSGYHTSTVYSPGLSRIWYADGRVSQGGTNLRRFVSCRSK